MNADRQITLTSCLLLYQYRQDAALGMDHITARQRGLLWYYNKLQNNIATRALTAAYLNSVIQQAARKIKALVKEAQQAEDKHKIARQVVALQEIVEKAKAELDALEFADSGQDQGGDTGQAGDDDQGENETGQHKAKAKIKAFFNRYLVG